MNSDGDDDSDNDHDVPDEIFLAPLKFLFETFLHFHPVTLVQLI